MAPNACRKLAKMLPKGAPVLRILQALLATVPAMLNDNRPLPPLVDPEVPGMRLVHSPSSPATLMADQTGAPEPLIRPKGLVRERITSAEVAAVTGLSLRTVQRLMATGQLPSAARLGGR